MADHTPEPWVRIGSRIFGANNRLVCAIEMPIETAPTEWMANGDIIAAAPETSDALVHLLRRYVELVESGDCGFWNPEEEEEVIAARAAIAKAKGE